ncbi:MAG: ATP-binding protein [Syntrophomonadaceae bacterium]|nr:ATP-binding protein [Syntrophomonadaceae bacterium]
MPVHPDGPAAVLPLLAAMVAEAGGGPEVFLRCAAVALWQIEAAGATGSGEWQGRVIRDHDRLVFFSRVNAPDTGNMPLPAQIIHLFEADSVKAVSNDQFWELEITQALDGRPWPGWRPPLNGWQLVAAALQDSLANVDLLRRKVCELNDELLLTNQGVLALMEDLREKERAMQQSYRLATIGRLVAGVAHEINNPLTFIKINTELIQRYLNHLLPAADMAEGDINAEMTRAVKAVFRGLDRITAIISGLKYFSRQERGEKVMVSLKECIQEAWMLVASEGELSRKVQFECYVPPDLTVYGNKQQLEQVMVNLLQNALKAIHKSGRKKGLINVTAAREKNSEKQVLLQVKDNGCGIAADDLPKIFEPFYTSDSSGTGLGLSIVQGIVAEHEGTVTVASEPGSGTVFIIRLPAGRQ